MSENNTEKQTSERRKAASRANGAKSNGPVTPEGKARSSMNAIKHGLKPADFAYFSPEEEQRLDDMRHNYQISFRPRDQAECDAIEEAVICTVKMHKCWESEHALLGLQMVLDVENVNREWVNPTHTQRQSLAFVASLKDSAALDRLHRCARSFSNQADRAMKRLFMLQQRPLPPMGTFEIEEVSNKPNPEIGHPEPEPIQQDMKIEAESEAPKTTPSATQERVSHSPRPVAVKKGDRSVARFAPKLNRPDGAETTK